MKRTIALGMSVALAMGGVATPAIAFAQTDNPTAQQQGEQEKYEKVSFNSETSSGSLESLLASHGATIEKSVETVIVGADEPRLFSVRATGLKPNSTANVSVLANKKTFHVLLKADGSGNAKQTFSYTLTDDEVRSGGAGSIVLTIKSFEGFLLKEKSTPQKENTDEYEHINTFNHEGDIKQLPGHVAGIEIDGADATNKCGKFSFTPNTENTFATVKLTGLKPDSYVCGTLDYGLINLKTGYAFDGPIHFEGSANSKGELTVDAVARIDSVPGGVPGLDPGVGFNLRGDGKEDLVPVVGRDRSTDEKVSSNFCNVHINNIDCWIKKDSTTNDKQPEPVTDIYLTANCDVIKKANGKYRLIYTLPSDNSPYKLLPDTTVDSPDWFHMPNGEGTPSAAKHTYSDNVKFVQGDNSGHLSLFNGLTGKPINAQSTRVVAILQNNWKDILANEITTKNVLPRKVIFDDVDVKDTEINKLVFTYAIGTDGYVATPHTPTIIRHFYNEGTGQTDDISSELETLLNEYNGIKKTDNYKNADDNLKQAYDKAITDGKAIYNKLSSTPEEVKQVAEKIKQALEKLNGDTKFQNSIQRLEQQLKDIKSQIDESQYEHINMFDYPDGSKERKDLFEKLKPYIANTHDENYHKIDLEKPYPLNFVSDDDSIDWYVEFENLRPGSKIRISFNQTSDSAKSYSATNNVSSYTDEKGNGTVRSDGTFSDVYEFINSKKGQKQTFSAYPVVDCWIKTDRVAELKQAKQQLQQAKDALEKLKNDKALSDEQKQAEIDKLNGQIENLGKQVAQLTNDKKTLSEQLQQVQSNLADVQKKLQTATEQGVADKSKIEQLNGQISTLNGQLEKLKSDKTLSEQQKQAEIDRLNGQIADLGKQIEQLTKEKQSLQQQLDTATDNIKKLTGELDKAKEQGTADKSTIQSLNEQLQQAKQQLEQLKSDKTKSDDQKQKEIDQLNAKIAELGKQITQLTKDKENLTQQLQTIQQSLSDVQKKLQKAQEQGTLDANSIATLNQQVKTLNEQLNQLKQDKTKSDSEKQKEIDKLNGQIEELNKQVTQLTKDKGSLQQQLDTANGKIQTLTDELNKAKLQGTVDKATIERINGELQQAKQQLEQLKQDKTKSDKEKQAEIDKLNGKITDLGKQIEQLMNDKNSLQSQLNDANSKIQALSGELEKAKQQGTADASTIAALNSKVNELQNKLDKLKEDKTLSEQQKQTEIDKLNKKIKELEKQVKDLSTRTRPENGSIILPNGNVINPDGTVVLLDGNKIKPDGTITDSQGKPVDTTHATVDKDGNKVLPNGIKIKPNGDKELPDGVIVKNNGNVILPDGKVVYFAGGAIVAPLINDKPEFDLEKYKKEHPEEFNNSTPDNNSSNSGSSTGGGLSVTVINGNSGSGSTNTTDKKETPKENTEKEKEEPAKQTPTTNTSEKVTISFVTKAKDLIATIEKEVDEKLDKKDVSAVKATAIKTKLAELKQRLSSSTEDEAKPLVNELKQIKADLDKQRDSQKIEKTDNLHDKRVLDKDKQGEDKFPKTSDNAPIGAVGVMVGMLGILFGSKYKKAKHAKK